ncbi:MULTISPECIES: DEAD/DEAH box helicase [Flavobacterium]|jgi:ATP-dependent RNA helicase RhlE|uniref:DEAD/DEAH box helicase n=1 Tax=Flavobacterium TaxID=237 RepID=UPI0006FD71DA|nr:MULTISPECIES: DEAD/DEAH box helicase [Flavobacterium]PZO24790.1 MAG: RNA helicase [Flavobacteriaceae bacterium]PZQ83589.1 MAG: RNA helicase [Flavobacterium johnsoniae]KQS47375.1 RNA helicase [Flavobacterium sp. Leaf359]MBL7869852.1 DEAD/DEAH box helicase [Flavobacterium lindanitolerans]MDQ7961406.1 DEAD/DEAH box helicase [Flavobacterium lindanitolerans]
MKLKKINEKLQRALVENGLVEANEMQQETFSTIKSGADCVIIAPEKSGKTTTLVINVIQRLEKAFEESPRALIVVESKEKMLEMKQLFEKLGNYTDLRVYGVHDKGDIDFDKNQISLGIDVLIGTPNRLSDMFSSAGFDVNRLKMFIIEDTDDLLRLRFDTKLARISESMGKTQRIYFSENITERVDSFADRTMVEPLFFEMDDWEEEEETE